MASEHPEIVQATYTGESPIYRIDSGRSFVRGQAVMVDDPDEVAIVRAHEEFTTRDLPTELIGTSEEMHPSDPGQAAAHNEKMGEIRAEFEAG